MKTHACYALMIGVIILASFNLSAPAVQPDQQDPLRKWEHLSLTHHGISVDKEPELSRQIVQLGDKGWELVTVSTVIREGSTVKTLFYFKRPK